MSQLPRIGLLGIMQELYYEMIPGITEHQAHYAAQALGRIKGVSIQFPKGFFKEFVVNFDKTGKTVARINKGLHRHGIFGGKDISREFPELGQSALYCVTEVHSREDIGRLAAALKEVAGR